MTYDHRDDWTGDEHQYNPAVHYRLYLSPRGAPTVICVQDFDYYDYDARRIISTEAWTSEGDAEEALLGMASSIEAAGRMVPSMLDADLRGRLLARAIRNTGQTRDGEELRATACQGCGSTVVFPADQDPRTAWCIGCRAD